MKRKGERMALRRCAKDIFGDAVEIPLLLRSSFLLRECGDDRVLREEVESLLDIHHRSRGFLARPTQCRGAEAGARRSDTVPGSALPGPGAVIGRYQLGPPLGEGGFGIVFSAEQRSPVRRTVALKVIKLGMDTRQVIARFEMERQTLALMDHPHIAKVLDAGATETGRPYFVMELVSGEAITAYCRRHALPLHDQLGIFLQVCSAVQHAHQKGVIHRDLKPANILVSGQDGRHHIKIVDFGIAKATGDAASPARTEHRQLVGTLEYMSPEQAARSPDIDTRVDVYALGGLLYELLTGYTPFDPDRLAHASPAQFERILADERPPLPSSRRRCADAAPRNEFARLLRADLDWVTMRCLEKDPDRRYGTVSALALDIERFLHNQPVSARPPSRLYTLSKLLERHRLASRMAAAAVAALLLGVSAMSYGLIHADRQRARAEAVSEVLRDVLTLADPARTKGSSWSVRDSLDQAVLRLDAGTLRGQPIAEADVRVTIGETFSALALYDEAAAQFRAAESILIAARGNRHPETLRVRALMVKLLVDRGAYQEAESSSASMLPVLRRTLGARHPDVLRTLSRRSTALVRLARFEQAAECAREALDGLSRVVGDHPDTVEAMWSLGFSCIYLGRLEEAERLARRAVEIDSRILGQEHPQTLHMTHLLGLALSQLSRFEEAIHWESLTLEARQRVLGPDNPFTLRVMANLGDTMRRAGRLDEAERLLLEASERCIRTLGPGHTHTIATRRTLSTVLGAQGRNADAVRLLRETLADAELEGGPLNAETIYTRRSLGRALSRLGDFEDADRCLRESLRLGEQVFGEDNPQTLATRNWLAQSLSAQGRFADAEVFARSAVEGFRRSGHPPTTDAMSAMHTLADTLSEAGKPAEALPVYEDILRACADHLVAARAGVRLSRAGCLIDLRRFDEAQAELNDVRIALGGMVDPPGDALSRLDAMSRRLAEARGLDRSRPNQ